MAKSKWMNALHPRKSSGYKFVKRIHFVDKVDFANKTLNQVGKRRRYLSKKEQAKERLKLIMLMDHPIIKLRCFTATYISRITLELIR
jgi:hypothetical protein